MNGRMALVMLLVACGGDKDGDTGGETGVAEGATFTRVKAEILTPSCALSGCHGPGTTANGMELVAGGEHAAMVNAPSIGKPGETLVIPNDAEGSYVVKKLEDEDDIAGIFMPYGLFQLEPDQIQLVKDWIDAGALDN